MRSLKKMMAFAAFAMLALTACQKEFTIDDDIEPPLPPVPGGGDSIYLSKIYGLADTGSGMDTIAVMTFEYDGSKRVILMSDSSKADPADPYIITSKYFYSGTDTMPDRFISSWAHLNTPADYDSTWAFFSYNAAGKKMKDSILNNQLIDGDIFSSLDISRYSYGSNAMYVETSDDEILPTPMSAAWKDTAVLNAAGDIVSNKNYRREFGTTDFELLETMNLVYDNKISPFKYLTSFMAHFSAPYHVLEIYDHMSKANILSENSTIHNPPGGGSYTRKSVYQYNSLGLPVVSNTILNEGTADEASFRLLFVYKKL